MHYSKIGNTQRELGPDGFGRGTPSAVGDKRAPNVAGILRLIAELRPQLNGGPVQVGSSGKLMSVNRF